MTLKDFVARPEAISELPPEKIASLVAELEGFRLLLWKRAMQDTNAANHGNDTEPFLSPEEVAALLNVPVTFVYERARRGDIDCDHFGKYVRFTPSAVKRFIATQRREPVNPHGHDGRDLAKERKRL